MVRFSVTEDLGQADKKRVLELWNQEFPAAIQKSGRSELEDYFSKLQSRHHYLMKDNEKTLQGWLMTFERNNDRWFTLLVDPSRQGKHYGSRLLQYAMAKESRMNGWVLTTSDQRRGDGSIYRSPLGFYLQHGFRQMQDTLEVNSIIMTRILWISTD